MLIRGIFRKRWKRFLSEVQLVHEDGTLGEVVTAHCPNSGSMKTLDNPGLEAWVRHDPSPKRKLKYTLVILGTPSGGLAVVDTMQPNRMVYEGVQAGLISELGGYGRVRREVAVHCDTMGDETSRFDLYLDQHPDGKPDCVVEIKNDTMLSVRDSLRADFPDAKTTRGAKHLRHLSELSKAGYRCVQFYLCNRTDCTHVGIADYIDPDYAAGLQEAVAHGVEVLCYRADISPHSLAVGTVCEFLPPWE